MADLRCLSSDYESGTLGHYGRVTNIRRPLPPPPTKPRPFRRAVLRGLALILPPVLTIVTLLWVASTVQVYVLQPVTDGLARCWSGV